MKILKSPDNIIFDTDNPNTFELYAGQKSNITALHNLTGESVLDHLNKSFKSIQGLPRHPIFSNFEHSYYWLIEEEIEFFPKMITFAYDELRLMHQDLEEILKSRDRFAPLTEMRVRIVRQIKAYLIQFESLTKEQS